ncbi:MAG: hypothetical protein O9333_14165 [Beijerinckiaceae bacterium]|jgi:hypothetical protein|nr:hypothetical protein [Beijerinckiaceae bacterium]
MSAEAPEWPKKTGSVFRRTEEGALIECVSYENEEGTCWTEETEIEPAPPPPAAAEEGQ